MVRWYEEKEFHVSLGRIISLICTIIGSLTVLSGLVAFFLKFPDSTSLVLAGTGILGLAAGGKTAQKFVEGK